MTKMNEKWWKKNKAKTLLNTGISNALRMWENTLVDASKDAGSSHHKQELLDALDDLEDRVDKAITKANKILHKKTIKSLNEYKRLIISARAIINKADNAFDKDSAFTESVAKILKKDKSFVAYFWDTYGFIYEMKQNKDKGSLDIYNTFIKEGAKYLVNIDGLIQADITSDVRGKKFNTASWNSALQAIKSMWGQRQNQGISNTLTRIKINSVLPDLKRM